jgi:hypothetical protein
MKNKEELNELYELRRDYDKKNCDPKNLITLCNSCHSKTNFNRKKWIIYFSSPMQ